MKITKVVFRTLLVLMFLTAIGGGVVSFVGKASLPPELQAFIHHGGGASLNAKVMLLIGAVAAVLALYTSIGLFFFWRRAKFLFLIYLAAGIVMTPLLGATVQPAWATTLYGLSDTITGMVIAILFMGSSEHLFERKVVNPDK